MSPPPKLRFLIADPLDGVQVFARRLLEVYGFDPSLIHCCSDSAAALAQGFVDAPDFLLTDWFGNSQPTGLQLVEQIKEQNPNCRVGFMSFVVNAEVEAAAQALGSRFLLKKPFGPDDLRRELQRGFEHLAQQQPGLMARVHAETQGRLDPRRRIELPPVPPPIKVGDAVQLDGKRYTVKSVVISKGEQLAELPGVARLVPASRLSR